MALNVKTSSEKRCFMLWHLEALRRMKRRKHQVSGTVVVSMLLLYPLQEAFDSLTVDVESSRRQGWRFAAKLVRGAYMYQERERARELGYDDPINPTYEATNTMYHR